jgi:hypothetical protein
VTQVIVVWLHESNVSFNESAVKVELLSVSKDCADKINENFVDELSNRVGGVVC